MKPLSYRNFCRYLLALFFFALLAPALAQDKTKWDYQLSPRKIAADTWVLEGRVEDFDLSNGCNIINTGFIQTSAETIVVNTGPSKRYGEQQRAAVLQTTANTVQPTQSALPSDASQASKAFDRQATAVLNLNLHPDYFFGNQAWSDSKPQALPGTVQGQQSEGASYASNLYKVCGDWMLATESSPATAQPLLGRQWRGGHDIELLRLSGHTADDLVLLDYSTGVAFVGGLVFTARIPTTPHAQIKDWLASLQTLETKLLAMPVKVLVPSHGPVREDLQGLTDTRDYLNWLDGYLLAKAQSGAELIEVYQLRRTEVPKRFQNFAVFESEYLRNLTHLYPRYEAQMLAREGLVTPLSKP